MFVSRLFTPLDAMPQAGLILEFLSPLKNTFDFIRTGADKPSFFGWKANIDIPCFWIVIFLLVSQMLHKIIMKKE